MADKHDRSLKLAEATLGEILDTINDSGEREDLESGYEKICGLAKKLELSIESTKDTMLEAEEDIEQIRTWSKTQNDQMKQFREARMTLKQMLAKKQLEDDDQVLKKEIEKQRIINEETIRLRIKEQKEIEAASIRNIEREKEWLERKLQMEKEAKEATSKTVTSSQPSGTQSVKLQRYTITPFAGDYKDWTRFWSQFEVEVDGSTISTISKLNYLLEMTKGKPRDDILGLPHTVDGYEEAKRILKSTYGKDSKVQKALIKEIESLHTITNIHKTSNIHEFYNKLSRAVRTLSTMKKLDSAQSTVYTLMDKLGPVREVLTQTHDDWEDWKLEQLTENLRKYVERNPLPEEDQKRDNGGRERTRDKLLLGNGHRNKRNPEECVYCGGNEHKSSNCTSVLTIANRREILKKNRLCYNCTGVGHSAANCRSRSCFKCGQKHHTSLCEKKMSSIPEQTSEKNLSASSSETTTIHATAHAKVNGQEIRVMIDTGASSSYICSDLVTKLSLKPVREEQKCIEQMYGTVTKRVEIYKVNIQSMAVDHFNLEVDCINAEKGVLTYLPNPCVKELKKKFSPLRKLRLSEERTQEEQLPVHIILGAADYQRIRSTKQPVLGENPDKDPGAEFTMLGWVLYGRMTTDANSAEKQFFLNSSQSEFERLCSLDVLGLVDQPAESNSDFHEDFISHLQQTKEGVYETRLPWKPDHPTLPRNKVLAAGRLKSVTRRLEKIGKLPEYHAIMQDQLRQGILEPVPQQPTGEVVHYIPHQPVFREDAESTKLRIVYDCSAKQNPQLPSLNDCLETGPALQPLLYDILLRNRMKFFCITGDVKKAFLQIQISEEDRDAQRTVWYNNLIDRQVAEYRFTRVMFGATPSPYILGAVLQKHVSQYQSDYPETAEALMQDTYVDDIQSGGDSVKELERFKEEATIIMEKGGFTLHKWHSNVSTLESQPDQKEVDKESTFTSTSKILGVLWEKKSDILQVDFNPCLQIESPLTKRKMLSAINGVYDILGWASPVTIVGKILFSEMCLRKTSWDDSAPDDIAQRWNSWIKGLRKCQTVSVPRSVVDRKKRVLSLHGFSDASKSGICAAVYVLATYDDGTKSQNLLTSKSRIAPKNASVPRLELVAAHTLVKLVSHVIKTLVSCDFQENHMWSDSMTTLYWIGNRGTWSKYVRNRVKLIQESGNFIWHYVPTDQNPSDLGTRGVLPSKIGEFWLKGPSWLGNKLAWPQQPDITLTKEVSAETLPKKKENLLLELNCDKERKQWAVSLLNKFKCWKLFRITALLVRFANNCLADQKRIEGPLTTDEIKHAENLWLKIAQKDEEMKCQLELKVDKFGLWRCHGRVPDYHPVFIPRKHLLAAVIIERCHQETIHGGVQTTMCKIRERFWIPQLRQMVKKVISKCNHCKKLRAQPLPNPPTSALPKCRAELTTPFSTTGVDFAGPMYCKTSKNSTEKAYVALFTCATTRAVHLKLCHNLTAHEFKRTLKEFIARRGAPRQIISDNAKTFVATKGWLEKVQNDDGINNYLASQSIKWKFNLSRAPWWGGFFERLVGIMKSALSKIIGKAMLTFPELEEVLLDIECFMNNRPLTYLGEEFEGRAITPNILLRGEPATFLEENAETSEEEVEVTRRLRYLNKCRRQLRKRWVNEYIHALDEKQRNNSTTETIQLKTGRVVLIKDSLRNKGQWRIGRVEEKIVGKDGVVRGYKIRTTSGYLVERPVQLIADLEIGGDETVAEKPAVALNPTAPEFQPGQRPMRRAKETAMNRIVGITLNNKEED